MQLMCAYSSENNTKCLGIFEEEVKQFETQDPSFKIPFDAIVAIGNPDDELLKTYIDKFSKLKKFYKEDKIDYSNLNGNDVFIGTFERYHNVLSIFCHLYQMIWRT